MDIQRAMLKGFARLPSGVLRLLGGKPIVGRGVALDPLMQIIWKAGKKQPGVDTMSPRDARAGLEAAATSLQNDIPATVRVQEFSIPGPAREIPLRIYFPSTAGKGLPVTLFFHFGGFVIGSRDICHGFCGMIADRARTIVVNVEYRLAPEHPFPAPIEDGLAVYEWALHHAREIGGDNARVAVAGDSAGGMISAVIAQEAKRRGWTLPRCQLLIYPWLTPEQLLPSYTDFADAYPLTSNIMKWFGGHYFRDEHEKKHSWAAPLDEPNLAGLPDALIYTAGFDPLRDEGELYAKRLRTAGVPVTFKCFEYLTHSFTMLGGVLPAAQRAMIEMSGELAKHLAR